MAGVRSAGAGEMCISVMVLLEMGCVGHCWCWMDTDLGLGRRGNAEGRVTRRR